jgi:hypothetical protein
MNKIENVLFHLVVSYPEVFLERTEEKVSFLREYFEDSDEAFFEIKMASSGYSHDVHVWLNEMLAINFPMQGPLKN